PVSGRPDSNGQRATGRTGETVVGALESVGPQSSKGVQSGKGEPRAGRGRVQRLQHQPRAHGESAIRVISGNADEGRPGTSDAAHGPNQFLSPEDRKSTRLNSSHEWIS